MTTDSLLCEKTRELCRKYILEPNMEDGDTLLISDKVVAIGTGNAEFFTSKAELFKHLELVLEQSKSIAFDIIDEWYEARSITDDVYIVYGGLWVKEKSSDDSPIYVEMNTRISIVYRLVKDGWEIVHFHQSMANEEQKDDEYYPKSLSEKAREALEAAQIFKKKSELDSMTGLFNSGNFKHYAKNMLEECDKAYFYTFDLDFFKNINDTHGHFAGDSIIVLFAELLRNYFPKNAVIGRIGGDEFAVIESAGKADFYDRLNGLQEEFKKRASKLITTDEYPTYSCGIAEYSGVQSFKELMIMSDRALYMAKRHRASYYYWNGENK